MKLTRLHIVKVLISALIAGGMTSQVMALPTAMTDESQQLINEMVNHVENTLSIVSSIESEAGNDINDLRLSLAIPARMSATVGMVLDINDANGYKVLSTSPKGFATTLGINADDTLLAINGLSTMSDNRRDAFTILENATPGETLTFDVKRKDALLQVEGELEGVFTPSILIELGSDEDNAPEEAPSESAQQTNSDACGQISTFIKPPRTRDLYSAYVSEIDGDNVIRRNSYKLTPGTHEISVHELIGSTRFKRRLQSLQRAKVLTLEVEENVTYYIAAKFIPENRTKQRSGEYWEPVVWKTKENANCSL